MKHFNIILFNNSGPANKQHISQSINIRPIRPYSALRCLRWRSLLSQYQETREACEHCPFLYMSYHELTPLLSIGSNS